MKKSKGKGYIFEGIFGIVSSLVFLYIVNIYYKELNFITEDFTRIIPLYNLSLITAIIFYILRIFFRNKTFKTVTELFSNLIFFLLAYNLWTIYPFDTSTIGNPNTWDIIFKLLIVLPTFAVAIASIVQLIQLPINLVKNENTKEVEK